MASDAIVPVKAWRAEDRLTRVELLALLVAYREGTSARALAEQYELGLTTVKQLLRKYDVRRSGDACEQQREVTKQAVDRSAPSQD